MTAAVPTLQAGHGYKLVINGAAFKDLAGNSLSSTFDGEDGSTGSVYVLNTFKQGDTVGPQHLGASDTPPAIRGAYPSHGGVMIPLSSPVRISFNEVVQAGAGSITLSTSPQLSVPVSTCTFSNTKMICNPPGIFGRKSIYSVKYRSDAVKDVAGNTLQRSFGYPADASRLTFTTIDIDYVFPTLAATSGRSFASAASRRLLAKPVDPTNGAMAVAKSSIVALTFSEVVQAGTGSITLGTQSFNVQSLSEAHWSGRTVYLQPSAFTAGSTNDIKTSSLGVFKDTGNQPLPHIEAGAYQFKVVQDDVAAPVMLQMTPSNVPQTGSTIAVSDSSPSTDITLYFSEAVQANLGSTPVKTVTVNTNGKQRVIKVDNSSPDQGSIFVSGPSVRIDPFDDLGHDQTVTVNVQAGAFKDLFGANSLTTGTGDVLTSSAGTVSSYRYIFKTPALDLSQLQGSNSSALVPLFSQREGAIAYAMKRSDASSYLLLYGGLAESSCQNDAYTSSTGKTWVRVSTDGPKVAYAKTAQDENGCIWMVGCESLGTSSCTKTGATIWKTCGLGNGTKVGWQSMPPPKTRGLYMWLYDAGQSLTGHAIAIMGGWQLVVLDSERLALWKFLDRECTEVMSVAGQLPFSRRSDPTLLASSDASLWMMGGHWDCGNDVYCRNGNAMAFTDVWKSSDGGTTWSCITVNYDPSLTELYSMGIGRRTVGVLAHDDAVFLIGGAKPNSTVGLNIMYSSYSAKKDQIQPFDFPQLQSPKPNEAGVITSSGITMFFSEALQVAGGAKIQVIDLGSDKKTGGDYGTSKYDVSLPISTQMSRQVLTVSLVGQTFAPDRLINIEIAPGSLLDAAGNTLQLTGVSNTYQFTTSGDVSKPFIKPQESIPANNEMGVSPRTAVILTMSEPVFARIGVLRLTATTGDDVELNVANATVVNDFGDIGDDIWGSKVFFLLPRGKYLTKGQRYTLEVPAGIFSDAAGNLNDADKNVLQFTVISGSGHPRENYFDNAKLDLGLSVPNNDTYTSSAPQFVSVYPPQGTTDIPLSPLVTITLNYTGPVAFNESGVVDIINSTSQTIAKLNVTYDRLFMNANSTFGKNATTVSFRVGEFLMKGTTFHLSVPKGLVRSFPYGNPCDGLIVGPFQVLEESPDVKGPDLAMMSPHPRENNVLHFNAREVNFWFSEAIQKGSGSITLQGPSRDAIQVIDINGGNSSIVDARLRVLVPEPHQLKEGDWKVQIPKGLVTDQSGNAFLGLEVPLTLGPKDDRKPKLSLSDSIPAPETSHRYELPMSVSFRLEFDEAVQAGSGLVHLLPRYSSPSVHFSLAAPFNVTGSNAKYYGRESITFSGSSVMIVPHMDLMPGEVYRVVIDADSFRDRESNSFAGLSSGYTISTSPFLNFRQEPNIGATPRLGASVIVDPVNNIYVMGGVNATESTAKQQLNDVWKFSTRRVINCAKGMQPLPNCTTNGLPRNASNTVTRCQAGNPQPYAGMRLQTWKVWRSRSENGQPCFDENNQPASAVGQVIRTEMARCPCPKCHVPPAPPYPTNSTIASAAYFEKHLPVSAFNGEIPLSCAKGFQAESSFVCTYGSEELGKFKAPPPKCELVPCTTAPELDYAALRMKPSDECMAVNRTNSILSGTGCSFECEKGFRTLGTVKASRDCLSCIVLFEEVARAGAKWFPEEGSCNVDSIRRLLDVRRMSSRRASMHLSIPANCEHCEDAMLAHCKDPEQTKGKIMCLDGTWALPSACERSTCDVSFLDESATLACKRSQSNTPDGYDETSAPKLGESCRVTCPLGTKVVPASAEQPSCSNHDFSSRPLLHPQAKCVEDSGPRESTSSRPPRLKILSSLSLTADVGSMSTGEEMIANKSFTGSLEISIAAGWTKVGNPLAADDVSVTLIAVVESRPRRLSAEKRKLASTALDIAYTMTVNSLAEAKAFETALGNETITASFTREFARMLTDVTGFDVANVKQSSSVLIQGQSPQTTPGPSPGPIMGLREPQTTPGVVASTGEPSSALESSTGSNQKDEDDETQPAVIGALGGMLLGVIVVSCAYYRYLKKKQIDRSSPSESVPYATKVTEEDKGPTPLPPPCPDLLPPSKALQDEQPSSSSAAQVEQTPVQPFEDAYQLDEVKLEKVGEIKDDDLKSADVALVASNGSIMAREIDLSDVKVEKEKEKEKDVDCKEPGHAKEIRRLSSMVEAIENISGADHPDTQEAKKKLEDALKLGGEQPSSSSAAAAQETTTV